MSRATPDIEKSRAASAAGTLLTKPAEPTQILQAVNAALHERGVLVIMPSSSPVATATFDDVAARLRMLTKAGLTT